MAGWMEKIDALFVNYILFFRSSPELELVSSLPIQIISELVRILEEE